MTRTSLRLGLAFILLISILWFRSTLVSLWNNGLQTAPVDVRNGTASATPEKPDRVVVVGKLKHENTDWVIEDLDDWQHAIYTVDDPTAPLTVPKNKGHEANAYLQYILDNYHALPSTIVFLHSHRDGYPVAWHTEFDTHSNPITAQRLQTDFVQRNGYVNMRCNPYPGCPNELLPLRNPPDPMRGPEYVFGSAWEQLFNNTNVPEVVGAACCAQFAVSREQVLKRGYGEYEWFHSWLMETELADEISGRVFEYLWHVIFGKEAVYCPDTVQCYRDVYGVSDY
ncbi:DUF3431 domain-containing protein [Aspergillus ruber CBS 135680]|uniref:Uncharacterized protein n=1 Tax=Aspergillus ruber (strain CBS 135680) TaxID=1388766 RepID=A0A017S1B0_ASPRC|nr:uncharacterized protein EURHEDRAFT_466492 [Aspergillus ruber CBS 135680]EYE90732.1 hypothetical protein EURHEDRAFT_466492 [Aspergillus ruber CBS 135680]